MSGEGSRQRGHIAVERSGQRPVSVGEGDESSGDEEGEVAVGGALTSGEPTEWGLGVYNSPRWAAAARWLATVQAGVKLAALVQTRLTGDWATRAQVRAAQLGWCGVWADARQCVGVGWGGGGQRRQVAWRFWGVAA